MSKPMADYDRWRPVIPQIKWLAIGVAVVLLSVWEMYYHAEFMKLPMLAGHGVKVLGAALFMTGGLLALFAVLQMYERQSAQRGRLLDEKTQGFSHTTLSVISNSWISPVTWLSSWWRSPIGATQPSVSRRQSMHWKPWPP